MNCREKNDYICNFCPPQIDGSYLLFNSNKTAFPNCCSYNYNPTQKNNEGQYRSNYFGYTEDYIKKFDQQRRSKRGSNAVQDSSPKLNNNNAAPRGFCPCMPPQNNMCVCANSFPQNAIRIPLNACVASSPIGPGPFNPCVCNEAPQVQDRIEFCNHQDMHENKLNGLGFHDILCNDSNKVDAAIQTNESASNFKELYNSDHSPPHSNKTSINTDITTHTFNESHQIDNTSINNASVKLDKTSINSGSYKLDKTPVNNGSVKLDKTSNKSDSVKLDKTPNNSDTIRVDNKLHIDNNNIRSRNSSIVVLTKVNHPPVASIPQIPANILKLCNAFHFPRRSITCQCIPPCAVVQTQTSCCEHLPQIPQPCKCCGLDTPSESQLVAEKTDEIPPEDQLCIPHEGTVSKYTVQNLSYRPFCVIVEEPENENCICNNDNNTKNNNININNNNNNNNLNNSYNNVHNGAGFNNFYQLRPYYWYCPYCGTIVCCKCPQACPYPYCTLNRPNQRLY